MARQTSDSASRDRSERLDVPKVLYVMGAGRSGSTILGVTLGNCADVFYAGELDKWLLRSGEPKLGGAQRLQFWENVKGRVADPEPLFGGQAHRYLERSSALFRMRGRSVRRRIREPYRRVMSELYGAIAACAGVTYLVDTSHYPLRARELQSLVGIDLYILFLVREPRAVIESFARDDVLEPKFNAAKTRAYLLLTHLLSVWVFVRQPTQRRIVLSHEEFLEDPEDVLRSLLDHVGSSAPIPDLTSLSTGFPLQGNRLIHKDVVSLVRRPPPNHRRFIKRLFELPRIAMLFLLRPRAAAHPAAHAPSSSSEPDSTALTTSNR
jgi:hypothetical protein